MTYFRPFEGAKWQRYDADPSWVPAYDGFREALDGDDDYDDKFLWAVDVRSDENLCMHANASFCDYVERLSS